MKYRFFTYSVTLFFALLSACSPVQKVTIPPVTVHALKPGVSVYRGSYTRLSDIIHTRLDLQFDWDSSLVRGKAYIDARPWFHSSDSLVLDAKGFTFSQVALEKNGEFIPLKYSYQNYKLAIKLDKNYTSKEKYRVFIEYIAHPAELVVGKDIAAPGDRGFFFVNADGHNKDFPTQFWTQGESECNSSWFPTINDPQEKMTQEISLTVPSAMVTLSNGVLDYSSENGDNTRTDTWRQDKPHSTYLTMVAAGNFKIVKDTWRDKEVSYYMEPAFADNARLIFGKTPEMLEFFSNLLHYEYPWDKYSQVVVRDYYGGAMENTTATVFFDGMNLSKAQYLDESNEDIVSHELFHHWFGDLATAKSWANLPLNESFATYGEYLWNEHKYGRDMADKGGYDDARRYFESATARDRNVIRYDYADREQMFDEVSYQKGGRILHMLRKITGDEAFFKALNTYLHKNAYRSAEISDLRKAFEEVTGEDMNWFFNEWFMACGHPVLTIETSYNKDSRTLDLLVRQDQDLTKYPLYRLPVTVDLYLGGNVSRKQVILNKTEQHFTWEDVDKPDLVNFDAERSLLAEIRQEKTVGEYVFQYLHAPLYMDRREALTALLAHKEDAAARSVVLRALQDAAWDLRIVALQNLSILSPAEQTIAYNTVSAMALADKRSYARAEALTMLQTLYKDRDNSEVLRKAVNDPAPSVQAVLKRN